MITTCDFRFVCPLQWDAMPDLPDGGGKHCTQCQRPVVIVRNRREFDAAARRGDCVAVFPEGEAELPPRSGAPLDEQDFLLIGDPIIGDGKTPLKPVPNAPAKRKRTK